MTCTDGRTTRRIDALALVPRRAPLAGPRAHSRRHATAAGAILQPASAPLSPCWGCGEAASPQQRRCLCASRCLVSSASAAPGSRSISSARRPTRRRCEESSAPTAASTWSGCTGAVTLRPDVHCGCPAASRLERGWRAHAGRARGAADRPTRSGWAARACPVPAEPARARPAAALRVRGAARARGSRASQTADTPFPYVPREQWGAEPVPAARRAGLRRGEGGGGAPHRVAERLHARGGARRSCSRSAATTATRTAGTTSATTRSSTSTARSTRAAPAGSTRRWSARTPRGSTRRRRASRTSATTRPSGRAPEALRPRRRYIRWKLGVHGQPLSGTVTLTSARRVGEPLRRRAAKVTVDRVLGHRDVGQDRLPRRRACTTSWTRSARWWRSGTPFADLLRAA